MRFRRSGINWEGRPWATTLGLNSLMDEIEAAFPSQSRYDGTVASETHDANNPSSDHRPRPFEGAGLVRAVDVGEYVEDQGFRLSEALVRSRDPRIKYVIHEGAIVSSYETTKRKAWVWGEYTGYNAHLNHVHVSLNELGDTNGSAWNLDLVEEEDMAILTDTEQLLLRRFLDNLHDIGSNVDFVKFLVPDHREEEANPGAELVGTRLVVKVEAVE